MISQEESQQFADHWVSLAVAELMQSDNAPNVSELQIQATAVGIVSLMPREHKLMLASALAGNKEIDDLVARVFERTIRRKVDQLKSSA